MNRDVGSARKAQAVDVSVADVALNGACRAIYVGGAGDLAVMMEGGGSVTFPDVPAGHVLAIACTSVLNSGTTASGIVALY